MNKKKGRFICTNFPTELAVKIERYGKLNHLSPQKALVKVVDLYFISMENKVSINLANFKTSPEAVVFRPTGKQTDRGVSFDNERVSMHEVKKSHPCRNLFSCDD